jgi:hypothetical protein
MQKMTILPTLLLSNPWRTTAIGLGLVLAGTAIHADRLKGQRDLCRERAVAAKALAEREAKIAAKRIAEAQASKATALASVPPVIQRITKERRVYYAKHPADNVRCLPAERVQSVNAALSQLAANAGIEAVPDRPAAGED